MTDVFDSLADDPGGMPAQHEAPEKTLSVAYENLSVCVGGALTAGETGRLELYISNFSGEALVFHNPQSLPAWDYPEIDTASRFRKAAGFYVYAHYGRGKGSLCTAEEMENISVSLKDENRWTIAKQSNGVWLVCPNGDQALEPYDALTLVFTNVRCGEHSGAAPIFVDLYSPDGNNKYRAEVLKRPLTSPYLADLRIVDPGRFAFGENIEIIWDCSYAEGCRVTLGGKDVTDSRSARSSAPGSRSVTVKADSYGYDFYLQTPEGKSIKQTCVLDFNAIVDFVQISPGLNACDYLVDQTKRPFTRVYLRGVRNDLISRVKLECQGKTETVELPRPKNPNDSQSFTVVRPAVTFAPAGFLPPEEKRMPLALSLTFEFKPSPKPGEAAVTRTKIVTLRRPRITAHEMKKAGDKMVFSLAARDVSRCALIRTGSSLNELDAQGKPRCNWTGFTGNLFDLNSFPRMFVPFFCGAIVDSTGGDWYGDKYLDKELPVTWEKVPADFAGEDSVTGTLEIPEADFKATDLYVFIVANKQRMLDFAFLSIPPGEKKIVRRMNSRTRDYDPDL